MPAFDLLATRIRGEYQEMPGLKLTLPQACRLWQLDANTCEAVLRRLVDERFLRCMADGSYVVFPATRLRAAKASLLSQQTRIRA